MFFGKKYLFISIMNSKIVALIMIGIVSSIGTIRELAKSSSVVTYYIQGEVSAIKTSALRASFHLFICIITKINEFCQVGLKGRNQWITQISWKKNSSNRWVPLGNFSACLCNPLAEIQCITRCLQKEHPKLQIWEYLAFHASTDVF